MSKKKRVKSKFHPKQRKVPHIVENVDGFRNQNFKWCADDRYIDYDDEEWGWGRVTIQEFFQNLLPRLQDYETMTWSDILRRDSCHDLVVSEICARAQRRLQETQLDIDTLHQIDMKQPCRLWGYRDRQILFLIWHDPRHTVYPLRR